MRKPADHTVEVQRYASRVGAEVSTLRVAILGHQQAAETPDAARNFRKVLGRILAEAGAPLHFDTAAFVDLQGYTSHLAVFYWHSESDFANWSALFDCWWAAQDPATLTAGLWIETFSVAPDYRETNLFQDFIRGLSSCPHSRIEAMDESGYWGSARDRFAASAYDAFLPHAPQSLTFDATRDTLGKHIVVTDVPEKLCVIRSGVTWENCGPEQLASFNDNLRPKLDAGMRYLQENPVDSGCCSLRQVVCLDEAGTPLQEAYSLGFFLTFDHLERWAHDHATHRAIYTRALAERKKYKENLELLTYHEVFVLNQDLRCEYINCHSQTGLLPFFTNQVATCRESDPVP